eukprot:6215715-Prymnesium_polylepis.1
MQRAQPPVRLVETRLQLVVRDGGAPMLHAHAARLRWPLPIRRWRLDVRGQNKEPLGVGRGLDAIVGRGEGSIRVASRGMFVLHRLANVGVGRPDAPLEPAEEGVEVGVVELAGLLLQELALKLRPGDSRRAGQLLDVLPHHID